MSDNTKIEWADATANFWIGCTKLSLACDHCYAERDWDHRKHRVEWGPHGDRSPVKAGPIVCRKMQRAAAAFIAEHGRQPRIFVNSLSDFADNHRSILPEWREQVWQMARECPDVIFMILTKRPQNLAGYLPADWGDGYPNVWIGTTVENQTEADRRIPHLLATPAAVRFLSCEPLLGPLDLTHVRTWSDGFDLRLNALTGISRHIWHRGFAGLGYDPGRFGMIDSTKPGIDWVIVGGESGPGARPMHPDWARSLRDQCQAAGVAFHFKQWGEWHPSNAPDHPADCKGDYIGAFRPDRETFYCDWTAAYWVTRAGEQGVCRVGKKRAGRLLDGREWDEVPDHG